ncbi:MAG: S8 family serine peptidase [Bifidobacteriaceae bacterium]|jgi:subtilisin family serine protease|nr:S8 family serine peptidase [Bifidobacteriaceae bacterium]
MLYGKRNGSHSKPGWRCVVASLVAGLAIGVGGLSPAAAVPPPDDVDPSRSCTVIGTGLGDVLVGTDGDDVICGGGGSDTILAGGGGDVVYGDDGGDTIYGGAGDDVVYGGAGGDTVWGEGIAGVNWNVRVLAYRVFASADCRAPHSAQADAIANAVARDTAVINLSLGGNSRNRGVVESLQDAWRTSVVVVAAAGNDGQDKRHYPAAYSAVETFGWGPFEGTYTTDVISVGNADNDGRMAPGSNYGDWVDLWAPGQAVLSTVPTRDDPTGYLRMSGTSMATPFVTGVASLVLSDPAYAGVATRWVRDRLRKTTHAKPGVPRVADLATWLAGRTGYGTDQEEQDKRQSPAGWLVNGYQAVSNASFEVNVPSDRTDGTVSLERVLGPAAPTNGQYMLRLSTGPADANVASSATVPTAAPSWALGADQELSIEVSYDFLTEEFDEWVGTQYNDFLRIYFLLPNGTEVEVDRLTVNTVAWTPVTGVDFPGGDDTVGRNNWVTTTTVLTSAQLARLSPGSGGWDGPLELHIEVSDAGDHIYDSEALIDNIRVY